MFLPRDFVQSKIQILYYLKIQYFYVTYTPLIALLLSLLGSTHSILELGVRVLLLHGAVHLHHLLVPRLERRRELALATSHLTSSRHLF